MRAPLDEPAVRTIDRSYVRASARRNRICGFYRNVKTRAADHEDQEQQAR